MIRPRRRPPPAARCSKPGCSRSWKGLLGARIRKNPCPLFCTQGSQYRKAQVRHKLFGRADEKCRCGECDPQSRNRRLQAAASNEVRKAVAKAGLESNVQRLVEEKVPS